MSYTFNAKETDKNLVEGKCACGNELSNPEHDRCLDCWKKARSGVGYSGGSDTQERIAYAQSWNLAVAMYGNLDDGDREKYGKSPISELSSGTNTEATLEKWQKYFYQKLTSRKI